ncbi:MAG: DinB family protein [Bacteroidetes bacterium]|nr:DinB family protein [Bacteroidota bacterium]
MHTVSSEHLRKEFQEITESVKHTIMSFGEDRFLWKPGPDKWCAAEVVEHLWISDRSGYFAMVKKVEPSERDPFQKIAELQARMEQPDLKLQAPEGAQPKGAFATIPQAVETWYGLRLKISDLALTEDLTLMALGFEHPRLGLMTRAEWLKFLSWHAGHHHRQLQRLLL